MKAARKVVLFFKSHVGQYVRKDGTLVKEHEDRRTKKEDRPVKAYEIGEADTHRFVHGDFKGHPKTFAGSFGLNVNGKHWEAYLTTLDDHDKSYIKGALKKPLAEGEHVLRYQSSATRAGGISPLVRINVHTKMVSFNESDDDDVITFGRPVHAQFLNVAAGRY